MTKSERLAIVHATSTAWYALCAHQYHNALQSNSYSQYKEYDEDKPTMCLRYEWCGLSDLCTTLKIDWQSDEFRADADVAHLLQEASRYTHKAHLLYREFSDYPYRSTTETTEEVAQ